MKKQWMLILTALFLPACSADGGDVDGFHTSWEAARKAAVAEDKPIYLHFTTTWCGWCRKIENQTYASDLGREALKDFVPASLDCTDENDPEAKANRALMHRLGGRGYPFLAMVTADGAVLDTISGYVEPKPFAEALGKAKAEHQRRVEFRKYADSADKESYAFNRKAMEFYATTGQMHKAAEAAEKLRKLDPENDKGDALEALMAMMTHAAGHSHARADGAVDAWVEQVRRFDPENKKGYLQQALVLRFAAGLDEARGTEDLAKRAAMLDALEKEIAAVTEYETAAEQKQLLWAQLGQANANAKRKAEALDALKKAQAAAPKSPLAKRIAEFMAVVEKDL